MKLILCGMMGSGKTTVGRKVAKITKQRWCDTDDLIVQTHGNIPTIFAQHGERYFRDIETALVKKLAKEDGLVISTGGGLVLKDENTKLFRANGNRVKIVYLRAKKETLEARLKADKNRPLLQSEKGLSDRLEELLKARAPIYENVADYIVDVDGKSPDAIAAEIVALANKNRQRIARRR